MIAEAAIHDMDSTVIVKKVNEALRGPVAEVLSRLLPELAGLTPTVVYDRVLNEPGLLTKCFDLFRRQRQWFRHVVVDARSRPVLDDTVMLSCGRTMEEVIAMIVRTSAKRYFRKTVKTSDSKPQVSTNPADELYEALKDYLMHEWQVSLLPAYAKMTPQQVRSLGSRLLVMRQIEELRQIIDAINPQVVQEAQQLGVEHDKADARQAYGQDVDPLDLYLSLDGKRLRSEAFLDDLDQPQIRVLLGTQDFETHVVEVLSLVSGATARILFMGLKITPTQLGVILLAAHKAMGANVFSRLFGTPGQPQLVLRLVQHGISKGIGRHSSFAECADFIQNFVKQATSH